MRHPSPALLAAAGAFVLLSSAGCESTQRSFMVRSFPQGALIYVDDEPRGHTDVEKLVVDFGSRRSVIVRLEHDGYQPDGRILYRDSDDLVTVFLEKSPDNDAILREIGQLQRQLDKLSTRIDIANEDKPNHEEP